MKTGLMISSIFYVIGLFFGNKVPASKNTHPTEKVIQLEQKTTKEGNLLNLKSNNKQGYYFIDSLKKDSNKTNVKSGCGKIM